MSLILMMLSAQAKDTYNTEAGERLEKSFSVDGVGTLALKSNSGSVRVETHKENVVLVEFEQSDSGQAIALEFEQVGNDVSILGTKSGDSWSSWGWSSNAKYTITVPEAYNVMLKTGGGSIQVDDLNGKVDAKTSGGSIKLGQINGDVRVKTSGGSIKVEEVAGNIKAHTSGGSIRVTIAKQPTEDSKLTTSGGSVTAYLADGMSLDVHASTSGGRVSSEFEVEGSVSKRSIDGRLNGGGPKLVLRTSGGSVKLKKI